MPVVTVSQLNNYVKRYIDQNVHLSDLWIKGEISNFKHHYSGHMYLTLKDETSTLKAVMFKAQAAQIKFKPADGMKVVAFGRISVYEAGGTYQLYIESIIPDGVGELYAAYEQLKQKLESEGLFLPDKKKPLPRFPRTIGVISSISGAALRDVLNVLNRRYPVADIFIYPAKVQGIGSADSICNGLDFLSRQNKCDVIILARGGGSIEDLWSFNEEKTARAIYACDIPVICGVGHETDYTISDFVADMRAPTPSAAAEIAVPSLKDIFAYVDDCSKKLRLLIDSKFENASLKLDRYDAKALSSKLYRMIDNLEHAVQKCSKDIGYIISKKVSDLSSKVNSLSVSTDTLNPFSVMSRGYTIATLPNGTNVDFSAISDGDEINLIFDGGIAECIVRRVKYEK